MRHWGLVITGFYALVVFAILVPGMLVLMSLPLQPGEDLSWWALYGEPGGVPFAAVVGSILVGGQALLLFLSVDTSWRRNRPRQHVAISAALTGFLFAVLAVSSVFAFAVAIRRDNVFAGLGEAGGEWVAVLILLAVWIAWWFVFYRFRRGAHETFERAVAWLLRGSVLELLIAVPAHVVVRSRGDCSAPVVTSWGIVTGIAIMLMCFGPGILELYRKRIDTYRHGARASPARR